jgi:catechol 2,3-dioxygenase-like lactoylglutathione lyase family enzyme
MARIKSLLRLLAGAVAFAAAPVHAQLPTDWTEAVVSVRDPVAATRLFREEGGWRITGKGRMSAGEKAYWRLSGTTGASFVQICAPAATAGCIRFVQFTGVAQRPIRLAARPWDTGGIFSIMIRSDNVQGLFDRAIAMGWWAESEPIAFDFLGSDLRNVVLSGPDGINIAAYERKSPPFTAFPVGRMSQGFNAMRFVRDERASVVFYRDKLGFTPVFDTDNLDPVPTTSNFSIPKNLTPSIIRRASALRPGISEAGRVEMMQLVGLDGRDFSQYASPPNLGILSLRYPVTDLAAYRAKLAAGGVTPVYEAKAVAIPGLGTIDLFAVRDPDGNLTEFYQTY